MAAARQHVQRLQLIKPLWPTLCLGLLFMLVTVAIQLGYPKAVAYFIDHASDAHESAWYFWFGLAMLALVSVQAVATALRYYLFESAGHVLVTSTRRALFGAIIRQPVAFFDEHNVGELTNRLASDVEVLQDSLTMGLAISLRSACVCLGGLVMLLLLSPLLSLVLIVVLPLSLWLGRWIGAHIQERSSTMQAKLARCGTVAQEHFSNIRLLHAFNRHSAGQRQYEVAARESLATSLECTRFFALFQGLSSLLVYVALLVTLALGAHLISLGQLTVGELTSFVIYAAMVAAASASVSDFWGEWMRSVGATERIFELMNTPKPQAEGLRHNLSGRVSFTQVEFRYPSRPDSPALADFNLQVAAGERIAVVGPSGAGKSTIASLLLGFYRPNRGVIAFDGVDAQRCDWRYVREQLAVVEQEPALFSGSIFDNIAYASDKPSRAQVIQAARQANAHDFIEAFPQGYSTQVGSRGVQLSGGQKQRLAIARAILRNPKILILDEATSALDAPSENAVQAALGLLMAGRTTFIIAHRFSTIAKADRVLVMEQGRVVQCGSPAQLRKEAAGLYVQLLKPQRFEAAIAD